MSEQDKSPDWKGYGLDQALVEKWVRTSLGDKVFENVEERGCRVLEEAIELFQVERRDPVTAKAKAHALVDAVFAKPRGDLKQEIGGVIVTLLALCAHHDVRLDEIAGEEIARIQAASDQIRKKQQQKSELGLAARPE